MKLKFDWKRFVWITVGVFILAVALYFALMPADLAVGGVNGTGMVLQYFFPKIPVGAFMFIMNIVLFVVGFIAIGKDFGAYTIYSSFLLSGLILLFEKIVPMKGPLVDDLFLNLFYGIVIQGVGMGIVFYQNASTGGTDILAKIINKWTHMNIGFALFLCDFIVVALSAYCFGLHIGLYALMGILINGLVIDKVIANLNRKIEMVITSDHYEEINDFILHKIGRGTTLYEAGGGFSKETKTIINTIVSRKQFLQIRKQVQLIDPDAFIANAYINEVYGEGFIES